MTRDEIESLSMIPQYKKTSVQSVTRKLLTSLVENQGITVLKDSTVIKHRGPKFHLYSIKELIIALRLFREAGIFFSPQQEKVVDKLLIELRIYKMNSVSKKMQVHDEIRELNKLGRLLAKTAGYQIHQTRNDFFVTRATPAATQGPSHFIKLNENKLRWENSAGKESAYDFSSNREATVWLAANIKEVKDEIQKIDRRF